MPTTTSTRDVDAAVAVLRGRRTVALTGAGISTDSGIPDYRGPGAPARTPMTYQRFVSGPVAQQRYWARAHVGWRRMAAAEPNAGHVALRALQCSGAVTGLITQNVDGLHSAAARGFAVPEPIDLHGRISRVVCLSCGAITSRRSLHERLDRLNPGYEDRDVAVAPDGDALLDDVAGFRIAACHSCEGPLKPDVVFFGENVPKARVARAFDLVAAADTLLVAGSSLHVMSGLRFVRAAAKAGRPVVIVNRGTTRGDDLATVKLDAGCSETLTGLVRALR